ncbi:MAG: hypothetical protein QME79_13625 [Bacillota bacterium]|nr:hypothetical protein [Bacillota bacterium]
MGTERIKVEYLPGYSAARLFDNYQPTIAVNPIWDERPDTSLVGAGYNMYGGKVESWASETPPTEILEQALIHQLENCGLKVVKTSGWNLDPNSIPLSVTSDFILGSRLKAFWVESRPGLLTVSINSKVTFDLIIADVQTKKVVWAGQFTGVDSPEAVIRTNEMMRQSLSRALTAAVNKVFQDDQVKSALIEIVRVRF